MFILTIIFLYVDLSIDTKNRVLLLSDNPPKVTILNDTNSITLDSIFNPTSLSTGTFSIWVASSSENKIQKYSLRGEYLGSINFEVQDIDVDKNGLLVAGDYSFLIELSTGQEIPIIWRNTNLCAICKQSIYLYGNDTLFVFERDSRSLKSKKNIPNLRDLSIYRDELVYLQKDSVFLEDTLFFIPEARRCDADDKSIWILTDSVVSISLESE